MNVISSAECFVRYDFGRNIKVVRNLPRDKEIISKNMRHIRSKDTSIEVKLRKELWHKGYRYRKNYKKLPGSPDIVLT